jgi:2-dehydro-3-deoxyphosphogluconate aldolase/(4S)-4-hydroxy-2-oxoglutarate aldolase
MGRKTPVRVALLAQKLLPLYYDDRADVSIEIAKALYAGGVRIFEYTNRGEAALENFRALRTAVDSEMPGLLLGIGTIKNEEQAQDYIEAGADFIVCPSMNPAVGEVVGGAGLLWIPGCMTPTEIAAAEEHGATMVKIFPGSVLGPGYISAVRDIFPHVRFIVTGGVEADARNLGAWFDAGVVGVGMGSKLVSKDLVARGDYEGLAAATAHALHLVHEAAGDPE